MKHLRKFWVSLVLLFTVDAYAISIDLAPNKTTITQGESVAVAVTISGLDDSAAPSLGVYDVDIHFDSSLFQVNSLAWGDSSKGNQLDLGGFGSLQTSNLATGLLNLFELSFDDISLLNDTQTGEFTLFTIVFNSLAIGSGNFSLTANSMGDAEGAALFAKAITPTRVDIKSVTVPEPSSLLLLLGLLAIMALRAKLPHLSK